MYMHTQQQRSTIKEEIIWLLSPYAFYANTIGWYNSYICNTQAVISQRQTQSVLSSVDDSETSSGNRPAAQSTCIFEPSRFVLGLLAYGAHYNIFSKVFACYSKVVSLHHIGVHHTNIFDWRYQELEEKIWLPIWVHWICSIVLKCRWCFSSMARRCV